MRKASRLCGKRACFPRASAYYVVLLLTRSCEVASSNENQVRTRKRLVRRTQSSLDILALTERPACTTGSVLLCVTCVLPNSYTMSSALRAATSIKSISEIRVGCAVNGDLPFPTVVLPKPPALKLAARQQYLTVATNQHLVAATYHRELNCTYTALQTYRSRL